MKELLHKAGLTPDILKDPRARALALDEFNARAGGLRSLMRGGKLTWAPTYEIPSKLSEEDIVRFLRFAGQGKRAPIIFAAGRATRMKLPTHFDRLGIAGLTGGILTRIHELREGEEAPLKKLEADVKLLALVETASSGKPGSWSQMSFLQRLLFQYRYQMEELFRKYPQGGVSLKEWLARAAFVVVANEANRDALSRQLAAVDFAGLRPEHVMMIVQQEEGGLAVSPEGAVHSYDAQVWPEGHGKPFMDMRSEGLLDTLALLGVERAVFAQVNDLHLFEDMAHVERWAASDKLIADGAEMVMEMVENGLSQKGGGIFLAPDGNTVMRDTIAMKTADLESYSVPRSLSRMFYELTLKGLGKLKQGALPAYITERAGSNGRPVLTREFYSGDASGVLRARAIQRKGYGLDTFKIQSRIPHTLEALQRQDSQPGFQLLQAI